MSPLEKAFREKFPDIFNKPFIPRQDTFCTTELYGPEDGKDGEHVFVIMDDGGYVETAFLCPSKAKAEELERGITAGEGWHEVDL